MSVVLVSRKMYEIVQGRWNRAPARPLVPKQWAEAQSSAQGGRQGGSKWVGLASKSRQTVISMRVPVLDDEWLVAALAATILLEAGHDVVGPASSAQEA